MSELFIPLLNEQASSSHVVENIFPKGKYAHARSFEPLEKAKTAVWQTQNKAGEQEFTALFNLPLSGLALMELLGAISHPTFQSKAFSGITSLYIAHGDFNPMYANHIEGKPGIFAENFTSVHQGGDLWPYFFDFLQNHCADFLAAINVKALDPVYPSDIELIYIPEYFIKEEGQLESTNANNVDFPRDIKGKPDQAILRQLLTDPEIISKLIIFLKTRIARAEQNLSQSKFLQNLLVLERGAEEKVDHEKTVRNFIDFITHNHRIRKLHPHKLPIDRRQFFTDFLNFCKDNGMPMEYQLRVIKLKRNGFQKRVNDDGTTDFFKLSHMLVPNDFPESFIYNGSNFSVTYRKKSLDDHHYQYEAASVSVHHPYQFSPLFPLLHWKVVDGKRILLYPQRDVDSPIPYNTLLGIHVLAYLTPEVVASLPAVVETVLPNGKTGTQERNRVQMTIEVIRPKLRAKLEESHALQILEALAMT